MRIRLLGQPVVLSIAVLAVLETVIFSGVLLAVERMRLGAQLQLIEQQHGALWLGALLFSVVMAVSLLAFGLYSSRQRARGVGMFARVLLAMTAGVVVTAVCFNLLPDFSIGGNVLTLSTASAAALVITLRLGFGHLVDKAPLRRRVLVYGTGSQAQFIAQLRRRADQRGFELVGFVQPHGEHVHVPAQRILKPDGSLIDLCNAKHISEIVVAMDDRRGVFPALELLQCRIGGIEVTDLVSFLERETGRVRIDVLNPSWLIFGKGFHRGSLRLFLCSMLDFVASVTVTILSLPVMMLTALAIKLEDGWAAPVLYRQERVGLRGRTFNLLKFRSMTVDAEANGETWAQENDPRVTKVGSIIRRLRIDELPQVVNVLRGDMRFVGPRPERPQFVANLSQTIPYYTHRHCVKPGITGWAQVCYRYGASEREALEKLEYDLYYIKNAGFMFDLSILMQTAEVVFFGKGAR